MPALVLRLSWGRATTGVAPTTIEGTATVQRNLGGPKICTDTHSLSCDVSFASVLLWLYNDAVNAKRKGPGTCGGTFGPEIGSVGRDRETCGFAPLRPVVVGPASGSPRSVR